MANLIGNVFSVETARISVITRRNNGSYEHKLLEASGNAWNIYEPAVKKLEKFNIQTIEEIFCYTEPKKATSEYISRRFSIFGKKFRYEKINQRGF